MLTVNDRCPGPVIRVHKGEKVFVNVHNHGDYGVTLHCCKDTLKFGCLDSNLGISIPNPHLIFISIENQLDAWIWLAVVESSQFQWSITVVASMVGGHVVASMVLGGIGDGDGAGNGCDVGGCVVGHGWYGVKQPRNPWSDGAEYITQRAIEPGTNFTYKVIFSIEEGTLWWHAHSDWTRAASIVPLSSCRPKGPLIHFLNLMKWKSLYSDSSSLNNITFWNPSTDVLLAYYRCMVVALSFG
ncbi:hypothetical protein F0562_027425 [Nyssa sinensis]|uniref:Plastocyanin-like domain-containing protein n=1 Tax=Nyssa sinensis TaxID=561372 RepID=A0A5J5B406_9ASTE|nr:hypothetical protein F0562_027425 [Nyssa sinensis]